MGKFILDDEVLIVHATHKKVPVVVVLIGMKSRTPCKINEGAYKLSRKLYRMEE